VSSPVQALGGVPNACQLLPTVVTGGQPSATHLAAFKAAGGGVVLDLRDPLEPRPLDEPATVAALGMEYVNVPVSAGTLSDGTLDRILAVDSPEAQRAFLAALGMVENEAVSRYGRAWKALDAAQRNELLTALATAPSGAPTRYGVRAVEETFTPTARDRFDLMKARIALAYFTSEVGLRELGYTGEPIHEAFAGCPHPDGHR